MRRRMGTDRATEQEEEEINNKSNNQKNEKDKVNADQVDEKMSNHMLCTDAKLHQKKNRISKTKNIIWIISSFFSLFLLIN